MRGPKRYRGNTYSGEPIAGKVPLTHIYLKLGNDKLGERKGN